MATNSTTTELCPYDVGAPEEWLEEAGLDTARKACAVPVASSCGMNQEVVDGCCGKAAMAQNSSWSCDSVTVDDGAVRVDVLPDAASNATYHRFQDCVLNYQGRKGGFRCNDLDALNWRSDTCNSLASVLTPPVNPGPGNQSCVTGAVAGSAGVLTACCGSAPVAFEGGCWQYCVGPSNVTGLANCIATGLRQANISNAPVGCFNGSSASTSTSASSAPTPTGAAVEINCPDTPSMLGLVAVLVWAVGWL